MLKFVKVESRSFNICNTRNFTNSQPTLEGSNKMMKWTYREVFLSPGGKSEIVDYNRNVELIGE